MFCNATSKEFKAKARRQRFEKPVPPFGLESEIS